MNVIDGRHVDAAARRLLAHRSQKRRLWLLLLLPVAACIYCLVFPMLWDAALRPLWISIVAPHPSWVSLPAAQLLYADLPESTHSVAWFRDGSALLVMGTDYEVGNPRPDNFIIIISAATGDILEHQRFSHDVDLNGRYNSVANLGLSSADQTLWGVCPDKELSIRGQRLDGNTWRVALEQANVVIGHYTLQSNQWSAQNDLSPQAGGFAFSPDCTQFVLTLSGWIYWEGDGQEELWLLDISKQSLSRVLVGEWSAFRTWDYPVERLTPSWAPDGKELVFGDSHFGLEIYNPQTNRRHWLAAPAVSGDQPLWSPSGQWIASRRFESPDSSIPIVSSDGAAYSSAGNCYFVADMSWAPTADSLAYLCQEPLEGKRSLWQWSIPEKP